MWTPQNNKVINCCWPFFSLDSLQQGRVPQNSRKLFGSAKQLNFVKLASNCFEKSDLMYVYKFYQNMILSKLSELKRFPSQIYVSPNTPQKPELLRKGLQISALFVSLSIAVLPWKDCLTFTNPIVRLVDSWPCGMSRTLGDASY